MNTNKKALLVGLGASLICLFLASVIGIAFYVFLSVFTVLFTSNSVGFLTSVPILGSLLFALPMMGIFIFLNRMCAFFSTDSDYRRGLKWGLLFMVVFFISGSRLLSQLVVYQNGVGIVAYDIAGVGSVADSGSSFAGDINSIEPSIMELGGLGYANIVQTGSFSDTGTDISYIQKDFSYQGGVIKTYITSYKNSNDAEVAFRKSENNLLVNKIVVAKIENIVGPSIGDMSFYLKYVSNDTGSARFRLEFLKGNIRAVIFIEDSGSSAQKLYEIGNFIEVKLARG